jgi:hypothetical protein
LTQLRRPGFRSLPGTANRGQYARGAKQNDEMNVGKEDRQGLSCLSNMPSKVNGVIRISKKRKVAVSVEQTEGHWSALYNLTVQRIIFYAKT